MQIKQRGFRWMRRVTLLVTMFLLTMGVAAEMVSAQGAYSCFPTCTETDGKGLAHAYGSSYQTLSQEPVLVFMASNTLQLDFGIFDANVGGRWDSVTSATVARYRLYADPTLSGDYANLTLLATYRSDDPGVTDRSWYNITRPHSGAAWDGSRYVYLLVTDQLESATASAINNFKVRVMGEAFVAPNIIFGFEASYHSSAVYDGNWLFTFEVSAGEGMSLTEVLIWDGDLDFGDGVDYFDTDDPDTPNTIPAFQISPYAVAEGAQGAGSPKENNPNLGGALARGDPITYRLIDPDSNVYLNDNPSGDREWEQFVVRAYDHVDGCNDGTFDNTDPPAGINADYCVAAITPGTWTINILGMDQSNINFYRMNYMLQGTYSDPVCPALGSIEGRIWYDVDGNGVQDLDEIGMNGVAVKLKDASGNLLATHTTYTDGNFGFYSLPAATYTVEVDAAAFPGGLTATYDLDGTADHTTSYALAGGETKGGVNFGVQGTPVAPSEATGTYSCLPTCVMDDGKMLVHTSGSVYKTLSRESVSVFISSTAPQLEFGIFDADIGGTWDSTTSGPYESSYTLYADPTKSGDPTGLTEIVHLHSYDAGAVDNGWYDTTLPQHPAADNGNGVYHYLLVIDQHDNPTAAAINAFKVRAIGQVGVAPGVVFGFEGSMYNAHTFVQYDGLWNFMFNVDSAVQEINVWDGDLDYGDGFTTFDTDDPDTPNTIPWFNTSADTISERARGAGSPKENNTKLGGFFARGAAITYELVDPNGAHYLNNNPSGDREWEKFTVREKSYPGGCNNGSFDNTSPPAAINADYCVDSVPSGIWQVNIFGMDLSNVNFFRMDYELIGYSGDLGSIGNTVWRDTTADGYFDTATEQGINGVWIKLEGDIDDPIAGTDGVIDIVRYAQTRTINGLAGQYLFKFLPPGNYTVTVMGQNFAAGGKLSTAQTVDRSGETGDGYNRTNGWDVILADGEDYVRADFGYRASGC